MFIGIEDNNISDKLAFVIDWQVFAKIKKKHTHFWSKFIEFVRFRKMLRTIIIGKVVAIKLLSLWPNF